MFQALGFRMSFAMAYSSPFGDFLGAETAPSALAEGLAILVPSVGGEVEKKAVKRGRSLCVYRMRVVGNMPISVRRLLLIEAAPRYLGSL